MIPDIQSQKDARGIAIDRVGVRDMRIPIIVMDPRNRTQSTIANAEVSVRLPGEVRGTHMSRFVEALNEVVILEPKAMKELLEELAERLDCKEAHISLTFPYFIDKRSPVSDKRSKLDVDCTIEAHLTDSFRFLLSVDVPVTTLCPCSKEISIFGAHNQRSRCKVTIEGTKLIWIEDVVDLVEKHASAPIYPLLKRVDEKFVTEHAYENPRFVEDVVRDIALELEKEHPRYAVMIDSHESIHNHNAFAIIDRLDRKHEA